MRGRVPAAGIGFFAIFLATACGGATPEPATPADHGPPPRAPAPSVAPPPAAGVWTIPEGPRDSEKPSPTVAPYKLETWKTATTKAKGVPAPGPECKDWEKKAKTESEEATMTKAAAAPPECGDAIADPWLKDPKRSDATDETAHKTIALSLAGRLARTAAAAPVMKDAGDKEKVKKFIQGPLRTWMVEQATAIDTLSAAGTTLTPAARAIVATEAGMADLRLVDKIRSAPTPASWDKELKAVYEAALDEALEPRKSRGRDAALVGLSDYAAIGVANHPRVDRARALLSKMYGGRRVNALDQLALPPETQAPSRARFDLGRTYWRKVDFVEAAHAASKEKGDAARLVLALSLALAKGPNGIKEMMAAPSPSALGLDHTEALDELAAKGGEYAGEAAFDAAYLRSLAVPDGDKAAAYLADVAARAKKAAASATDPTTKKKAEQLATDAEAAAKATK